MSAFGDAFAFLMNETIDVTMHKPALYRPDIDGLRAIAVLSVLCIQVVLKYVVGGFVGVDVFFEISGADTDLARCGSVS